MLAILGVILIAIWIIGLVMHIAGGFIHLVLLIALISLVMHFVSGSKPAA